MSEDTQNQSLELEEVSASEEDASAAQNTTTTSVDGEGEEKPLSIEDNKSSENKHAELQINVWTERVARETDLVKREELLKQLSENPTLDWVATAVKKNLRIPDNAQKGEADVAREVLAQDKFEVNKAELYSLPTKIRNDAVKEYQELKELGADPFKTMEKVLAKAKDAAASTDRSKEQTRAEMQIPRGRNSNVKTTYTMEQVAEMSQTEYNQLMELEKSGEVTIVSK